MDNDKDGCCLGILLIGGLFFWPLWILMGIIAICEAIEKSKSQTPTVL
jgi:hypothetical protein